MTDALRDELQQALGTAYTITRELGGGGMSRVFVAHDTRLDRDVVVKVLSTELAAELSAERFAREIKLVAALQEPHIVPVISDGVTASGLPFYIMPYVEGASLRERLRGGRIPTTEALSILRDVAKALAYAHGRGIVHRDIKPDNILLSSGTAVVTDFGIAKALQESRTQDANLSASNALTQNGVSIGTPAYMSPEQATGDSIDARADLYAWGVVAYELLSGAHPFASKTTAQQLIAAHLSEAPPALITSNSSIPRNVATVVMRCLAKDPAQRPSSAGELLSALDGAALAVPDRRKRKVAVAVGTLIAIVGAYFALNRFQPGAQRESTVVATAPIMLAVLPFENIGADEQAIFTDGLTDAVASKLSTLSSLGVIDRRSAAQYRQSTKPNKQIGAELGVRYLVQGVVRWAKDASGKWRAQVTPTLVDLSTGASKVVGQSVLITPEDPFTAQGVIAGDVARAMEVVLAPADQQSLTRKFTDNPQAFAAYQRGRAELDAAAENAYRGYEISRLKRADEEFTQAASLDSNFAEAFGYLTLTRTFIAANTPGNRTAEIALRQTLDRALQVAPTQPLVMLMDAKKRLDLDRDTTRVDEFVNLALQRARGDANVMIIASRILWQRAHYDSALALAERAVVMDPRSSEGIVTAQDDAFSFRKWDVVRHYGEMLLQLDSLDQRAWAVMIGMENFRGDTLAAQKLAARTLKGLRRRTLVTETEIAYTGSAYGKRFVTLLASDLEINTLRDSALYYFDTKMDVFLRIGDPGRALVYSDSICALLEKRLLSGNAEIDMLLTFSYAQAYSGRPSDGRISLERAISLARTLSAEEFPLQYANPAQVGAAYARLGEFDQAVKWLTVGLKHPATGITAGYLQQHPKLLILHGNPKFEALLRANPP